MKYEKYEGLLVSSDFLEYEFNSTGPKGIIPKAIKYESTPNDNIYNLAFGTPTPEGSIDDETVNDNKDRNKILATVAHSVTLFCGEHPNKWIHFSGSTVERTRLYRMAISVNLEELSENYEILGILKDTESYVSIPFQRGLNYFGFLIKKKIA
ncbi:hypothetical protein SAMN05421788_108250 [Filimonas lacunae]|uniref:Uncharacterized protein n=1 Tax=Filimonas lacunae TaxID=477680 RepID=A0A173MDG5_9BACT|nr:hypothetical protein [Filimonas lacunae]BAV05605.1 hypothetical protein FLA_1616 [Filimonas lacunae]SIT29220.1 hypothetical protein SAMN05421788_108250 [Filimonas lacunae]